MELDLTLRYLTNVCVIDASNQAISHVIVHISDSPEYVSIAISRVIFSTHVPIILRLLMRIPNLIFTLVGTTRVA